MGSPWLNMDDEMSAKSKTKKPKPQGVEWDPFYQEKTPKPIKETGYERVPTTYDKTPHYGDATSDGGYWGDAKHPLPAGK